jgi:hypothetical protein
LVAVSPAARAGIAIAIDRIAVRAKSLDLVIDCLHVVVARKGAAARRFRRWLDIPADDVIATNKSTIVIAKVASASCAGDNALLFPDHDNASENKADFQPGIAGGHPVTARY